VVAVSLVLERLCDRLGIASEHPEEVQLEAQRWLERPGIDDPSLADLTHLPFVTIDNDDSRDLDQAMAIAREGPGYRIDYALADASYYVSPGSALFAESLRRGASYYLPGRSVPMLPRALSEGLISLNEGAPRRALVMRMHVDERGEPKETRFVRARIRSRRKLSYAGVQQFYDGEPHLVGHDFTETLELLREVGQKRIDAEETRGVADYDRRETEIGVEAGGERFTITGRRRHDVEKYNEQVSLLCNMEGARLLESGTEPFVNPIFRVHGSPARSRIRDLSERIEELIGLRSLDPTWRWNTLEESVGDYLRRLPDAISARTARAIHRQAVVINNPGRFSAEVGPHFGIGATSYSRFSAPMREIVGVFTHKEALEKLAGRGIVDPELRDQVVDAGNRAKETQKALDKEIALLVIDQVLHADLERSAADRPVRDGTVLGITPGKMYVELDDPPLELKVYVEDLSVPLSATPERSGLTGERGVPYALGDLVRLQVDRYDPARRRWCFSLAR
jgi:ribonuclease R